MENGDKKIKKGIKLLGYGMFGITEVISVSKKDMLYNLKILGDFDETFWVWIVIIVFISATMTVLICYIKEKNKTIRKEIVCTKKYNKINKDLRKKKKKERSIKFRENRGGQWNLKFYFWLQINLIILLDFLLRFMLILDISLERASKIV
jgi:hypothetical protein